jgi:CRP/FNR family cyclic AMP-dependent transcriptional regulator
MAPKQSPDTAAKFHGPGSKQRIINALAEQTIIGGNVELAAKLFKKIGIKQYPAGKTLMKQGGEDTHLSLILVGQVDIVVNGRLVATRKAGEHVGEMSALDTLARRSATVRTKEATTVAEISEYDFNKLANRHPEIWKKLALTLGVRLRQRSQFHSPPREKPAVFIASSSEGLRLAECIHQALGRNPVVPRIWSRGVFEAGRTTIEDLVKAAGESDFAIIVTSKDDTTTSRSRTSPSPRDNVIFELGLFMGALSRERTLVLVPKDVDFKLPSDLLGMTLLRYTDNKRTKAGVILRQSLKTIRAQIAKYGPK